MLVSMATRSSRMKPVQRYFSNHVFDGVSEGCSEAPALYI